MSTAVDRRLPCSAILALLLLSSGVHAAHSLGARADLGLSSLRDDLLVPLAFTGPAIRLGLDYGMTLDRHSLEADLSLSFAATRNRFDQQGWEIAHDYGAGYAYCLQCQPQREWWLGVTLRQQTDLAFFQTWDDAHGYWLASWALSPTLRHDRALWSSGFLETRAEVGLFGLYSRPPTYRYNKQDDLTLPHYHFDRSFASPHWFTPLDVQLLRLGALLRFRSAEDAHGTGPAIGAEVRFARASEPAAFASLYTGLRLGWGWGW